MKTVIIAVLMACAGTVYAGIRQWDEGSQMTQIPTMFRLNVLHFFDECRLSPGIGSDGQIHTEKGWISLYGDLDGGTMFDTNLVALDPTATANLAWDFGASGFSLSYIIINDGLDSCKIYGLLGTHGDLNIYQGDMDVSAFNGATIQDIALWGRVPGEGLPDNGSTCLLFAVGIVALWLGRFDNTTKQAVKEGN